MCIWSTIRYQYIWKKLLTYQYVSFETWRGNAENVVGGKEMKFSFWTALNWIKCILMVSLYIWLSMYTKHVILCIIWKFDLSSRGVLGRIYALSIEVLATSLTRPRPGHLHQRTVRQYTYRRALHLTIAKSIISLVRQRPIKTAGNDLVENRNCQSDWFNI